MAQHPIRAGSQVRISGAKQVNKTPSDEAGGKDKLAAQTGRFGEEGA